jgi:hypothetical protein
MLVWLATSGAQAGGIVLGLLLLLLLAGPFFGAGAFVLASARAEDVSDTAFASKQRVFDADRLFRTELVNRLRDLADTPGLPDDRIRRLARTVERSVPDEAAWFASVQLTDAQIGLLQRYDDLVWERVHWLREHASEPAATAGDAVEQLERAIDERADLLVRGRQAPSMAPGTMFTARSPDTTNDFRDIAVGDAVTRDDVDYIVEAVATGFADGQTWRLAHLAPSGASGDDHWLEVAPGGFELAWLERVDAAIAPGAADFASLPLSTWDSAATTVSTRDATQPAVLVRNWRYRSATRVAVVQQWPDGAIHAYRGSLIPPRDLRIWQSRPAAYA